MTLAARAAFTAVKLCRRAPATRVLSHSLNLTSRLPRLLSILAELDGQSGKQQQDQGDQPPLGNGGEGAWLFRQAVGRTGAAILTAQNVAPKSLSYKQLLVIGAAAPVKSAQRQ